MTSQHGRRSGNGAPAARTGVASTRLDEIWSAMNTAQSPTKPPKPTRSRRRREPDASAKSGSQMPSETRDRRG